MIDSGINQCVIKGKVTQENFCRIEDDAYRNADINGHGSMCASIIERMTKLELEFVSAKIFHRELRATERQIVEALTYMMDMRVDIINMSLSVSLSDSELLRKLCHQLNELGIILVSASANSGKETLFDSFGNVVTVVGSSFFDGTIYWYRGSKAVCDIEPILVPWYENEYEFFGGNSKATALFTAIVINAEDIKHQRLEINKVNKHASKSMWEKTDLLRGGIDVPSTGTGKVNYSKLIDQRELMQCVECVTGISAKKWAEERDWFANGLLLTANQVQKILRELIAKNIIVIEEDAEIFMEYFRNQNSFLKFTGY